MKYITSASALGGREGSARSEDGRFKAKLSTPKELGGAGGDGTNPEQLFAAGYSACFIGALGFVAIELMEYQDGDTLLEAAVAFPSGGDPAPAVLIAPEKVLAFADEMNSRETDWRLHAHGRALHAFTHVGARAPGMAYDADADRRSGESTTAFLHELFARRNAA